MGSFAQNLEAIQHKQQINDERLSVWIEELRLRWLRTLLFNVNSVLHKYDSDIKIKGTIILKEYDLATIKLKEFNEINGVEHIRASALYLIGFRDDTDSWARLETSPEVKTAFDGIISALNNYIKKYDSPYKFENKINELVNKIGWDQIENWVRFDSRKSKSKQRERTDIKSMLGSNDAVIELVTEKGKFKKIIIRKNTSRTIDSPIVIEWFIMSLKESKYKDRFFDDTQNEDSQMIFSSGEIYDFLCSAIRSTVEDFGAGNGERKGTIKEKVTALTPLYKYLKNDLSVADADVQIIRLFGLENVLKPENFATYIEKSAKIKA